MIKGFPLVQITFVICFQLFSRTNLVSFKLNTFTFAVINMSAPVRHFYSRWTRGLMCSITPHSSPPTTPITCSTLEHPRIIHSCDEHHKILFYKYINSSGFNKFVRGRWVRGRWVRNRRRGLLYALSFGICLDKVAADLGVDGVSVAFVLNNTWGVATITPL